MMRTCIFGKIKKIYICWKRKTRKSINKQVLATPLGCSFCVEAKAA